MSEGGIKDPIPPLRARAEAAAWNPSIHDPDRTAEVEERFKRWLAESEDNRAAWERQHEAWDLAKALGPRFASERARGVGWRRLTERPRRVLALATAAAAVIALLFFVLTSSPAGTVTTAKGERRVTLLPDGSRVTLNTDTRITLLFGAGKRRVRLDHGEALFDVMPAQGRPFIVVAGKREVRALGTSFEVRRDAESSVSVTLIEGRISIEPVSFENRSGPDAPPAASITVLDLPGQRATFAPHRAPKIDHAVLQQVISWQSGEVVFADTPLPEAAREMNRYSDRQIIVQGAGTDSLHIGGLFQAGDSIAFAQAVAQTFDLELRESGRNIVLSRRSDLSPPRSAPSAQSASSARSASSAPSASSSPLR